MKDMSVQAVAAASQQDNAVQKPPEDVAPPQEDAEVIPTLADYAEEESKSLAEMIKDAQEKAEANRNNLKVKNNTRYGDAPLEAYARLARAKNKAQVNAASGFARRKLFQLKAALHSDSENTPTIRGAINQLQKSINRAERKKRELDREQLLDRRQAKARREKEEQKAKRLRQELQRKRNQRIIRESGYTREAVVSEKIHAQLTQTQMELRQQMQDLSASTGMTLEAVAQQYAAQAAPPEAAPGWYRPAAATTSSASCAASESRRAWTVSWPAATWRAANPRPTPFCWPWSARASPRAKRSSSRTRPWGSKPHAAAVRPTSP